MSVNKSQLLDELNVLYAEVGKLYYTEHRAETKPVAKYADLFMQIRPINAELEKLENEELLSQGLKKCQKCGKNVVVESRFCNMCGYMFESIVEVKESVPQKRVCKACGSMLEEDAVFCANCGVRQ